jgi:hypothetical protein
MRRLQLAVSLLLLSLLGACKQLLPAGNPPLVSITVPTNGATEVATDASITAKFTQAMDPATVDGTTFRVAQGSGDVPGTVAYAEGTATFTPKQALSPNTPFTATLTVGCTNSDGLALGSSYAWSFTTLGGGALPDVSATRPLNEAVNVWSGQQLDVTFNEAMDPRTLTASTFTVTQGRAVVAGNVSYDAASDTATFTPTVPLGASLPYDAEVDTGAKSAEGRSLVAPLSWSFTTRAPGAPPPPPVVGSVP